MTCSKATICVHRKAVAAVRTGQYNGVKGTAKSLKPMLSWSNAKSCARSLPKLSKAWQPRYDKQGGDILRWPQLVLKVPIAASGKLRRAETFPKDFQATQYGQVHSCASSHDLRLRVEIARTTERLATMRSLRFHQSFGCSRLLLNLFVDHSDRLSLPIRQR